MAAKNPFEMMDVTKMLGDFKMPGVDVDKMVSAQKKNVEALTSANQLAAEGFQAVARRQAEILRQTFEEAGKSMRDLMEHSAPEDRMAKQTELAKTAFEAALSNMRELAEMVTKANAEAFDVINRRVAESLDELRDMIKKPAGRK
ncbi:MAG: phasin family protein [Alphaproteobacteria bacterium]|nr:phasin family protein [Alphaproteobacteria bacterium]